MRLLALILLAGSLLPAQAPTVAQLEAQFDTLQQQIEHTSDKSEMVRLMKLQDPICTELAAQAYAQSSSGTAQFVQAFKSWAAIDPSMEAYREQQRRYRHEPWHREFWRRR